MNTTWHQTNKLTILNIYAPNDYKDHPPFWEDINEQLVYLAQRPGIMLGDFNIVEDKIDQAPARLDDEKASTALRDLRNAHHLQDAWRHAFQNTRQFIFRAHTGSLSRLDQIYAASMHQQNLFQWEIGPARVPTDHDLVSVRFSPTDAPQIGKGRWTWPLYLINNKKLLKDVIEHGNKLEKAMLTIAQNRTETQNPQTMWATFKKEITTLAREEARTSAVRMDNKINNLRKDIATLANEQDIDTNKDTRINKSLLHSELDHLAKKRRATARVKAQAQWTHKGEKMGRYWTKVNSARKPKEIIHRLRIPGSNPPKYTTHSVKMAEIAKQYHENLQVNHSTRQRSEENTTQAYHKALREIPASQKLAD